MFRMVAFLTASVAANTTTWRSATPTQHRELVFPVEQPCDLAGRVRGIVRSHLDPRSVWFQDSAKAALALGLAVAVAAVGNLEHGFWVVLGRLSVLRSNAFDTGLTALQAAAGTAIGFAVSILVFTVVGLDRPLLWIVSMTALFLAAYVPQAINFVVGQMMFTIAVVTAFNLVQPQGWETGLVRFRDIAIGAGISFVVAILFWPRRADRQVSATVTALYGELAPLVPAAVRALRQGTGVAAARRTRVAPVPLSSPLRKKRPADPIGCTRGIGTFCSRRSSAPASKPSSTTHGGSATVLAVRLSPSSNAKPTSWPMR